MNTTDVGNAGSAFKRLYGQLCEPMTPNEVAEAGRRYGKSLMQAARLEEAQREFFSKWSLADAWQQKLHNAESHWQTMFSDDSLTLQAIQQILDNKALAPRQAVEAIVMLVAPPQEDDPEEADCDCDECQAGPDLEPAAAEPQPASEWYFTKLDGTLEPVTLTATNADGEWFFQPVEIPPVPTHTVIFTGVTPNGPSPSPDYYSSLRVGYEADIPEWLARDIGRGIQL